MIVNNQRLSTYLSTFICGLITLISHTIASSTNTRLTFELPDNEQMCFTERFTGQLNYIFEYGVLRGGNNDADVTINSPNKKVLYDKKRGKKGRYEFMSVEGEFEFCFGNQFSAFTHKIIQFSLRPRDVFRLAVEAGVEKPWADTALEASCNVIHEMMSNVVTYQRDYRVKESIGRANAGELNDRVALFSAIGTGLIVVTGLGQVLLLKQFFSKKQCRTLKSDNEVRHHTSILQEA